jgi:hypothetical protein
MAYYVLVLKDEKEFYSKLQSRDPELVLKMVKSILSGIKQKRDKIDIFDITFKDTSELMFSIEKSQYTTVLSNCMSDLEKMEEYELCILVKKVLDKASKKAK